MAVRNNPTVARGGKWALGIVEEFKTFILRGNVVDLAVGIVIGAAFSGVVQALVKDLITPLIGIFGKFSFPDLYFTINGSKFLIGEFVNAVIAFIILALVVFFFVVKPVNSLMSLQKKGKHEEPTAPTTRECPFCLSSIALKATRCAYCTAPIPPVEEPAPVAHTP